MKTEYEISGMRENGGLHEIVIDVELSASFKSPTSETGPVYNDDCTSGNVVLRHKLNYLTFGCEHPSLSY